MSIGAGAAFGVVLGTVLGSVAATLGATTAFLLSRYCARGWVERRIRGQAMYAYFGSLTRATTAVHERSRTEWTLYLLGLLGTVLITVSVTRIARNALARRHHSAMKAGSIERPGG